VLFILAFTVTDYCEMEIRLYPFVSDDYRNMDFEEAKIARKNLD
jgi:hypothetical protein